MTLALKPRERTVTLLCGSDGLPVRVYARRLDAERRRDELNADPWIEPGTPDPQAPYEAIEWVVQ